MKQLKVIEDQLQAHTRETAQVRKSCDRLPVPKKPITPNARRGYELSASGMMRLMRNAKN